MTTSPKPRKPRRRCGTLTDHEARIQCPNFAVRGKRLCAEHRAIKEAEEDKKLVTKLAWLDRELEKTVVRFVSVHGHYPGQNPDHD